MGGKGGSGTPMYIPAPPQMPTPVPEAPKIDDEKIAKVVDDEAGRRMRANSPSSNNLTQGRLIGNDPLSLSTSDNKTKTPSLLGGV